MNQVQRLENEINQLQQQLRRQNEQAENERRKIVEQNRQALEYYQADMQRAVREHDTKTQKEYERLLSEYQRKLDGNVQSELSGMSADYQRLLQDVKRNEAELERKNQELQQAIQAIRNDVSRRNEGSSQEARQYLLNATGVFRTVEVKPHEKFTPKRLRIFYNAIKDGQELYKAGLYEAATAVAISAKSGLERLSYTIDDKMVEWDRQYELFIMKLNYLSAKVQQELSEWEEYIQESSKNDSKKRKEHLVEINYWTRGEFADLVKAMNRYRAIAKSISETGKEEYLKKEDSANTDDLKEYIKEIGKLDEQLSVMSQLYKLRYSASCERADWGEAIIDFLTEEINLDWKEEMTGYRKASAEVLKSKDFVEYIKSRFNDESVTEDTREWLKLVFENASGNQIYIYLLPVEAKQNVENRIIIHIDYGGAEQELYSRDIYQHVCEAINYSDESGGIVNYAADLEQLKLSTNKAYSDTAKDLEQMRKANRS